MLCCKLGFLYPYLIYNKIVMQFDQV